MKTFFSELFEYNRFMNQELIKAMVDQQDMISDRSLELMNHILNAQQRWNSRVNNDRNMYGTWDLHALDELSSINEALTQTSLEIIKAYEFDAVIVYSGPKGIQLKNSVRDILFHIINHGTYHRGQIAMDFRQSGLKPLETDYDAWRDCL